jgi:hypothetical protein
METMQLLLMARIMGHSWHKHLVVVELDSLGLTQTLRRGRHKDPRINDILKELALHQVEHGFELKGAWVRRCWNEAADALSKDDMDRFWRNVKGDRTEIQVTEDHRRMPGETHPGHIRTGGMRRTAAEKLRWDARPTRELISPIRLQGNDPEAQLAEQLKTATAQQSERRNPLHAARSGIKHYLRFCERIGQADNVAPPISEMVERVAMWLQDAPQTYTFRGTTKKKISATTIPQYLSHIDTWWSIATGQPKCLVSKQPEVTARRQEVTAAAEAAQRQVHGISAAHLRHMTAKAAQYPKGAQTMLQSAHTLAWFGMLRPTEYMTTPAHPLFDRTRHMRAGDVQLYKGNTPLHAHSEQTATHMTVNVKQSKTDHQRMGAGLTLGATTDTAICPVRHMQQYLRHSKPPTEGPLYPGLQYRTMLKTTRALIKKDPELYGLHSFRVGGAQAMALSGRSFEYIMAKGRWKHLESVIRYVETPMHIRMRDSQMMTQAQRAAPGTIATQVWGEARPSQRRESRNL